MNKLKLIFLLFIVFRVNSQSQKIDTIYGNPKSVKEKVEFLNKKFQNYKFLTDGDYGHAMIFTPKIVKNKFEQFWYDEAGCFYINYEKEFLRNGKPKSEDWFTKKGGLEEGYEYKYDKNNNLIEQKEIYYHDEYTINKFTYNNKNKPITSIRYYSDEVNNYLFRFNKYDSLGRLNYSKTFYSEGGGNAYFRNYDANNNLISVNRLDVNLNKPNFNKLKEVSKAYEYEYDDRGNKILENRFDSETNEIISKHIYKYDERNNLIFNGYGRDSITSYRKYGFNKKNQKTHSEYVSLSDSSDNKKINYYYDEKGFIKRVLFDYGKEKYNVSYEYKFDKVGNWVEQIKIVNGEALYKWTRKIKYFD